MRMQMIHGPRQTQIQLCNICGAEGDKHIPACPRHSMQQIHAVLALSTFRCPSCREGTTSVNHDDFIECQQCHDQFTFGASFALGGDKIYFLGDNIAIKLDWKGKGEFHLLKRLKELAKLEKKMLRKKKKE